MFFIMVDPHTNDFAADPFQFCKIINGVKMILRRLQALVSKQISANYDLKN
jgi:hypothetical protein